MHRAVWDRELPVELFQSRPPQTPPDVERVMQDSLDRDAQARQGRHATWTRTRRCRSTVLDELGEVGYWGLLVDKQYGGSGAPFASFAAFLTKMAMVDATVAGLASVHGCIGAVDPVRTFGNPEQKATLPARPGQRQAAVGLRPDRALRRFGPDGPAHARPTQDGDDYVVNGEKLFITNVVPGRTVGLVCLIDKRPAVLIVDLPEQENEQFQLRKYGLWALKHTYNQGIIFKNLRVPAANLLKPKQGDGLTIAYHGLNLGRISLCANAAGTMRLMMASMIPWAKYRKTYGAAIATRELVQRRLGRLAGLIVACDALVQWGGGLIDEGYRGEMECVIAKIFGSEVAERSRDRAVDEDARRPLVPARPHVRRQRARVPGPLHLRGRRRNALDGLLQVAGQAARRAVLRADRQGPASRRHQEAEHGQPGPPVGPARRAGALCQVAGRPEAAAQAARPSCRPCPRRLRAHAEFASVVPAALAAARFRAR